MKGETEGHDAGKGREWNNDEIGGRVRMVGRVDRETNLVDEGQYDMKP